MKQCNICTEPKEAFKETCGNNNHEICENCYKKWTLTELKNTCPTCRAIIKNGLTVE